MQITATIRWSAPSATTPGVFTVVVRDEEGRSKWVLWTRDKWLAALCDRYNQTPRPELTVIFDPASKQLETVALPVAASA